MKTLLTGLILTTVAVTAACAEEKVDKSKYLTKDGKLTHKFNFRDTQGGFAGFTGQSYAIEPDGSWSITRVFNRRKFEPHAKGKLTAKQLKALGEALAQNKMAELPAVSNSHRGANPMQVTIIFGKTKCECSMPTAVSDPDELPKTKDGDIARRVLAVRKVLQSMIKPKKAER